MIDIRAVNGCTIPKKLGGLNCVHNTIVCIVVVSMYSGSSIQESMKLLNAIDFLVVSCQWSNMQLRDFVYSLERFQKRFFSTSMTMTATIPNVRIAFSINNLANKAEVFFSGKSDVMQNCVRSNITFINLEWIPIPVQNSPDIQMST